MQATTQAQTTTGRTDLAAHGFTPEQIQRFEDLRAIYPMIEMVENVEQLRRLMLLKWLHQHRTEPADRIQTAA